MNQLFKKMLFATIYLSLSFANFLAQAQTQNLPQTIKGRVIDENNLPLAYANVVLLKADSTYVNGTVTDTSGHFSLGLTNESYLLRISFVGYDTKCSIIECADLGTIQLQPGSQILCGELTKGQLPKTELRGDAFATPIKGCVLSKAGSANDVLQRLPGVIRKNGDFEVFGKGTPLIYINGRMVRDNNELEYINSEEILDAEVITNPGARYDAAAKAVIRINTIKKQGDGFSFDFRSSTLIHHSKFDWVEQINLNYRYNNLDIFASLGYSKTAPDSFSDITQSLHSENLLELQKKLTYSNKVRTMTPILGFNYQFNPNHSIGFRYYPYAFLGGRSTQDLHIRTFLDGTLDDNVQIPADGKSFAGVTQRANVYYNGTIGQLNIDFNADIQRGGALDSIVFKEQSEMKESRDVHTINGMANRLMASKLVFTYPLLGGNLSAGSEYTWTEYEEDYRNPEKFVPNIDNILSEHNVAAFAEYSRSLSFGSFSAGVRYEHVDFSFEENGKYDEERSCKYNHFFPHASLSAVAGPVQLQLSYTAKARRPLYHQLTNISSYLGRYGISRGNPTLKPQISQDLSFSAVWKFMQLSASYQVFKDAIINAATAQPDLPNIIVLRPINYGKNFPMINARVSATPTIGVWTPRVSLGINKQWLTLSYMGEDVELKNPVLLLALGSSFTFPKGFMLDVDYSFQGKGHILAFEMIKPMHQLDISLRKSFFNDALIVELRGIDLFALREENTHLYSGVYQIIESKRLDANELIITIRYNFNSAKSKYKGTGAGERERNRL
jgi:hypothetical protein